MRARDAAKLKKGDTVFLKQWGIGFVTVEKVTLRPNCPEVIYDITIIDRFGKSQEWTHLYYQNPKSVD